VPTNPTVTGDANASDIDDEDFPAGFYDDEDLQPELVQTYAQNLEDQRKRLAEEMAVIDERLNVINIETAHEDARWRNYHAQDLAAAIGQRNLYRIVNSANPIPENLIVENVNADFKKTRDECADSMLAIEIKTAKLGLEWKQHFGQGRELSNAMGHVERLILDESYR